MIVFTTPVTFIPDPPPTLLKVTGPLQIIPPTLYESIYFLLLFISEVKQHADKLFVADLTVTIEICLLYKRIDVLIIFSQFLETFLELSQTNESIGILIKYSESFC
jgi:hypothetical protein